MEVRCCEVFVRCLEQHHTRAYYLYINHLTPIQCGVR